MKKDSFAILIKPGLVVERIAVERAPTLETVQAAIGGWVEQYFIREAPGLVLLCDEEGKLKGRPATFFYDAQWFVGDVLLVTNHVKRNGDEEWRGFASELEAGVALDKLMGALVLHAPRP